MVKSPMRTPYGRAVAKSHATSAARLEVHHCQAQIVLNKQTMGLVQKWWQCFEQTHGLWWYNMKNIGLMFHSVCMIQYDMI